MAVVGTERKGKNGNVPPKNERLMETHQVSGNVIQYINPSRLTEN